MKIQNTFVIIVVAFCSGCANPANLVKGWKSHDVAFDPPYLQSYLNPSNLLYKPSESPEPTNGYLAHQPEWYCHIDRSIINDCTAYAYSIWPKDRDFFISDAEFYEDGTGQHAVRIVLEPALRDYVEYYLFYDENNKRTKVMKGKTSHPFHM